MIIPCPEDQTITVHTSDLYINKHNRECTVYESSTFLWGLSVSVYFSQII